jgi:hypothetical protein
VPKAIGKALRIGGVSKKEHLTLRCPECGADMKVDIATGTILSHHSSKPSGASKDFDALLAGIDDSKNRANEIFDQEVEALEHRERLLDEKFREAMERVEEEDDGSPPPRPWDLD